jgi:thioredoxin 2
MAAPDKLKTSCLSCGATNFYPLNAGGKAVVCGRCRTPLPEPGKVLEPTAEEAAVLIQEGGLPVLIDFTSTTCMPCHMMSPIVESLARRRAGDIVVLKVNTERQAELAGAFKIKAVPTFVVMKKGYELGRISGAMPETDFSLWVASKA